MKGAGREGWLADGGWALYASRRAAASCARLLADELLPARPFATWRGTAVVFGAAKFCGRWDATEATDPAGDTGRSAATLRHLCQMEG